MKISGLKYIVCGLIVVFVQACTSDFEDLNTDPYGVTDEELEQDFNDFGVFFPGMLRMLVNTTDFQYQIAQNLTTDSWAGYFGTPTDFAGGANNTTYKMTWRDETWNDTYDEIMSPAYKVMQLAEEKDEPQFSAWAELIRIYGIQKVASLHGPVIYSHYGESSSSSAYDSEEEFYKLVFERLDEVNAVFEEYTDFEGFKNFDVSAYKGDVGQWLKLSNSLRLMLALRIEKIAPDLAQEQAEKAAQNPHGFFQSNDDNFSVDLGADKHPIYTIGYSYNDTRMSATMESFLVGYKDPRVEKYFAPVATDDIDRLTADHKEFPYKGVKNGARINDKEKRTPFSNVGEYFITAMQYTLLNFADVNFMLAEAKLRGWDVGTLSPKEYYEEGVMASFEQWGATGADEYLEDKSSHPIDYRDPVVNESGVNAFDAQTDITIQWDESDSNERKLERIMTQKWIAGFPNSMKAWVDFRRTGYPAIEPIYKNDSGSGDGVIPDGEFIKRMRFVPDEYNENPSGVQEAVQKLGGPDEIGTRLWWDTGGANF